jgi:hypothetical protein
MVIYQIFEVLFDCYDGKHTWGALAEIHRFFPLLIKSFEKWLARHCETEIVPTK